MKATKRAKKPKAAEHLLDPSTLPEAERHLRAFCDRTSYELSSAVGALVGELGYLAHHPESADRGHTLQVALNAAERALKLSRNLRYFAAHHRLETRMSDVSQILLDSVDLFEHELEAQNIQVAVFAGAFTYALVDPGALQQVLLNLLSHAGRSMAMGGKLTLTLRQLDRTLEIRMSDTGPGVTKQELERLFNPYASSSRTTSETQRLGLAVAKILVEAHGGDLTVDSETGKGTTFRIRLPFDSTAPKPGPYPEKRRYRRVDVTLPVELIVLGSPVLTTEVSSLSLGGCFIRIPSSDLLQRVQQAGSIGLRIAYYFNETLEIKKARVVNAILQGPLTGVGVEFLELDQKARKLLSAMIQSHSA